MSDVIVRQARPADLNACCAVEAAAFPADEAASSAKIKNRLVVYPEGFLVAKLAGEVAGELAGIVMSGATHQPDLADEALKDMVGHDPTGENLVVFSVAVLPEMQGRGLGGRLVEAFLERGRGMGKERVLLLCKENLLTFYGRHGFVNAGLSASTHGGARWYEMRCEL